NFLTGEDYSYLYNANSIDVISTFAWETVKLQFAALILSLLIAIPVGVISATRQYSKLDNLAMTGALLGISLPVFWTGLMLILIFAFYIPIFPSGMAYTQLKGSQFPWYGTWSVDAAWHMVLPVIILGTAGAALITRLVRSSMLEVLRQDYIITARSKGLTERLVVYKHALRNALLPVVTIVGLALGGMLGGAALTETVFNWPGLGRTAVVATIQRDYYLVLGINVVLAMILIIANLLTDISYAFLDPRIRY
ncbi:MAG: ABC transporter permease, partial [Candidatus Hodarchaeales archaeon]